MTSHPAALGAARDRETVDALQHALVDGSLSEHTSVTADPVARPAPDAHPDAGFAEFAGKRAKKAEKKGPRRGLTSQDVENESQRSRKATDDCRVRAEAAITELRKAYEFTLPHDEFEVSHELATSSLEQYLHRQRQRFADERNKKLFRSNMDAAERQHLFDEDFDTMQAHDTELAIKSTEDELTEIGLKLGIIRPTGEFAGRCECGAKLDHIKVHVKLHERKLTKAKMVRAFHNQIGHLVTIVDDLRADVEAREQERLAEVLDAKEKHFLLLAQVQNQKQQLDRLRRKVKDGDKDAAKAEEEDREAQASLEAMRAQLKKTHSRLGGGRGGGGGGSSPSDRRRMTQLLRSSAANEQRAMAMVDFDGHEDPAERHLREMRAAASFKEDTQMQTASEQEFFEMYGMLPHAAKIGFRQPLGGSSGFTVAAVLSRGPGKSVDQLRRVAVANTIPAIENPPDAIWAPEASLMESSVTQLTLNARRTLDELEKHRGKLMSTVAAVVGDDEDACEELCASFALNSSAVRDVMRKFAAEVAETLRRTSAASRDMAKGKGGMAASVSSAPSVPPAAAGLGPQELRDKVRTLAAERDAQKAQIRVLTDKLNAAESGATAAEEQAAAPGGHASEDEASSKPTFAEYVDETRSGKGVKGAGAKKGRGSTSPAPKAAKAASPAAKPGGKGGRKKSTAAKSAANVALDDNDVGVSPGAIAADQDTSIRSPDDTMPLAADQDDLVPADDADEAPPAPVELLPEGAMSPEQTRRMQEALVRIARLMSESECIEFGHGVSVDLELAESPTELVGCMSKFISRVSDALKSTEALIPTDVVGSMNRVHKSVGMLVTNIQRVGIRFPTAAVEALVTADTSPPSQVRAAHCIEDLKNLEANVMQCSMSSRQSLDDFVASKETPLVEALKETIGAARSLVPSLRKSLATLLRVSNTYAVSSAGSSSRADSASDATGTRPDSASRKSAPTKSISASNLVSEPSASAIGDSPDDAVEGLPWPRSMEEVTSMGLDSQRLVLVASSALADCLPRLAGVVDAAGEFATTTIERLDGARDGLHEQIEARDDEIEELKRRLRLYEPEDDGSDADDGMTTFERQAVMQRDQLAAELEEHRDMLREVEATSQKRGVVVTELSSELDLARREMHAATEEGKEALRQKEIELLERLADATVEAEVAERHEIEEAHYISFLPIATTFHTSFSAATAAAAATAEPKAVDAEVMTDPVPRSDAEATAGAALFELAVSNCQTDPPEAKDEATSITPPPEPEPEPVCTAAEHSAQTDAVVSRDVSGQAAPETAEAASMRTPAASRDGPRQPSAAGIAEAVDGAAGIRSELVDVASQTEEIDVSSGGAHPRVASRQRPAPDATADAETHETRGNVDGWSPGSSPASTPPPETAVATTKTSKKRQGKLAADAADGSNGPSGSSPSKRTTSKSPAKKSGGKDKSRRRKPQAGEPSAAADEAEASVRRTPSPDVPSAAQPVDSSRTSPVPQAADDAAAADSDGGGGKVVSPPTSPLVDDVVKVLSEPASRAATADQHKGHHPTNTSSGGNGGKESGGDDVRAASGGIVGATRSARVVDVAEAATQVSLEIPPARAGDAPAPDNLVAALIALSVACQFPPSFGDAPFVSVNDASARVAALSASVSEQRQKRPAASPDGVAHPQSDPATPSDGVRPILKTPGSRSQAKRVNLPDDAASSTSGSAPASAPSVPASSPSAGVSSAPGGRPPLSGAKAASADSPAASSNAPAGVVASPTQTSDGTGYQFFGRQPAPQSLDAFERIVTPATGVRDREFSAPHGAREGGRDSHHGRSSAAGPSKDATVSLADLVASRQAASNAAGQANTVVVDTANASVLQADGGEAHLIERPTLASSRSLRPGSRGLVDVDQLLGLNTVLCETLTEVFKRLDTKKKVEFENSFDNAVEPPLPSGVIVHMHSVLSSVHRLLHSDSRLARRSMTHAIKQAAVQRRLENLQRLRAESGVTTTAATAAFLDRQEEKLRHAEARLTSVRQQIVHERAAAFRDFFLPVTDVVTTHVAQGLLPRRRGPTVPLPGLGEVADAASPLQPQVHAGAAIAEAAASSSPPPVLSEVQRQAEMRAVSLNGEGFVRHGPDARYQSAVKSSVTGTPAMTPTPEARERASTPTRVTQPQLARLPPVSKTPGPTSDDPRDAASFSAGLPTMWHDKPSPAPSKGHVLSDLRPPPRRRNAPHHVVQPFRPDRMLFTTPLQGHTASFSVRSPSPPK